MLRTIALNMSAFTFSIVCVWSMQYLRSLGLILLAVLYGTLFSDVFHDFFNHLYFFNFYLLGFFDSCLLERCIFSQGLLCRGVYLFCLVPGSTCTLWEPLIVTSQLRPHPHLSCSTIPCTVWVVVISSKGNLFSLLSMLGIEKFSCHPFLLASFLFLFLHLSLHFECSLWEGFLALLGRVSY